MSREGAATNRALDRRLAELCIGCMETRVGDVCIRCGWNNAIQCATVLQLPPRTVLKNQYVVGRVLGQGGFGITYLALDLQESRKVALKEYFPQAVASRAPEQSRVISVSDRVRQDFDYGLHRFMEEGRLLSLFRGHPCIVAVLESFQANGTGYLVMEYLDGLTLRDYLASKGQQLPWDLALRIMNHVLDGLKEVHSRGLLHRDVSPDNIYLTRARTVKLIDFGAARFAAGERSQNLSIILKPGFAPEEQYRQRGQQGPWTDIYAAAATLYRAITGTTPPDSLDRKSADTLVPPSALGITVPPTGERALMKGLSVHARDRFASTQDFQLALSAATADVSRQEERRPRQSRPSVWAWAMALIALLLVIFAIYSRPGRPPASSGGTAPAPSGPVTEPPKMPSQKPPGTYLAFEGRSFRLNYPPDWEVHTRPDQPNTVDLTPSGAFLPLDGGRTYITHGIQAQYVTDLPQQPMDLQTFTNNVVGNIRSNNQDVQTDGQQSADAALITQVSLRSLRGDREINRILTVQRPDGFFVLILVAPAAEFTARLPMFMTVVNTLTFTNK
jgi:serine/threonine protein kinase